MSKIEKTWKLPRPFKEDEEYEWQPVVRVGRVIPFGYYQDPNDEDILLPIPEELELLEEAKKHLKQYSSREVSAWLTEQSGRYISHTGLLGRIKLEARRKTQIADSKYWANRYKEAMEKAEKLEKARIGGREYSGSSNS